MIALIIIIQKRNNNNNLLKSPYSIICYHRIFILVLFLYTSLSQRQAVKKAKERTILIYCITFLGCVFQLLSVKLSNYHRWVLFWASLFLLWTFALYSPIFFAVLGIFSRSGDPQGVPLAPLFPSTVPPPSATQTKEASFPPSASLVNIALVDLDSDLDTELVWIPSAWRVPGSVPANAACSRRTPSGSDCRTTRRLRCSSTWNWSATASSFHQARRRTRRNYRNAERCKGHHGHLELVNGGHGESACAGKSSLVRPTWPPCTAPLVLSWTAAVARPRTRSTGRGPHYTSGTRTWTWA